VQPQLRTRVEDCRAIADRRGSEIVAVFQN